MNNYSNKTLRQLIDEIIWFDKPFRLKEIFNRLLGITSDLQEQIDNIDTGGGSEIKEAVYYIGGQDETGLFDVVEKKNTIGINFGFVREGVGAYRINGFNLSKHIVEFDGSTTIQFIREEGAFFTKQTFLSNTNEDFAFFEFGGFIRITEY
jgi:hypothetical protein